MAAHCSAAPPLDLAGQPGAQRELVQGEVATVLHQVLITDGLTCGKAPVPDAPVDGGKVHGEVEDLSTFEGFRWDER